MHDVSHDGAGGKFNAPCRVVAWQAIGNARELFRLVRSERKSDDLRMTKETRMSERSTHSLTVNGFTAVPGESLMCVLEQRLGLLDGVKSAGNLLVGTGGHCLGFGRLADWKLYTASVVDRVLSSFDRLKFAH